jgi:phosphohistidine phosphatase
MRRLLLLRHAKAERARPGETDHERVLAERGQKDSKAVAAVIAERGEHPDLVLCSTSVRTRQTFEPIRPALAGVPEERFLRALFEAGRDYIALLRQEAGTAQSLLLIGHNPAIHETAVRLAANLDTADGKELSARFPTAALAIFDLDGDWADIRPGSMRLAAFVTPRGSED